MSSYVENRGGPASGVYHNNYIENNNTPSLFTGNFASLFASSIRVIQADKGVTSSSGSVTAVADQSANGNNIATSGTNPSVNAGFNGHATILFDGAGNAMSGNLPLPASGYYIYAVFAPIGVQAGQANYCGNTAGYGVLYCAGASLQLRQFSGATGNICPSSMPTGSLLRVYAEFTGSISDVLKVGSFASVTGSSAGGVANPAGIGVVGAGLAGGTFGANINVALLVYALGTLSPAQLSAIDAYANTYWGGVIT